MTHLDDLKALIRITLVIRPDTFIKFGWFEQITLIETDTVSSSLVENNDLLQEVNLIAWN